MRRPNWQIKISCELKSSKMENWESVSNPFNGLGWVAGPLGPRPKTMKTQKCVCYSVPPKWKHLCSKEPFSGNYSAQVNAYAAFSGYISTSLCTVASWNRFLAAQVFSHMWDCTVGCMHYYRLHALLNYAACTTLVRFHMLLCVFYSLKCFKWNRGRELSKSKKFAQVDL